MTITHANRITDSRWRNLVANDRVAHSAKRVRNWHWGPVATLGCYRRGGGGYRPCWTLESMMIIIGVHWSTHYHHRRDHSISRGQTTDRASNRPMSLHRFESVSVHAYSFMLACARPMVIIKQRQAARQPGSNERTRFWPRTWWTCPFHCD